jgi:hypothetical protein
VSDGHEKPSGSAIVHVDPTVDLLVVHDRHPKIGREEDNGSTKFWRSYADDREWMLIQLNHTAHAAIVLKMTVPIVVAEHHIWSAVWPMII